MKIIKHQSGITENLSSSSFFIMFDLKEDVQISFGLKVLQRFVDGKDVVAGFGKNLLLMFNIAKDLNYQRVNFKSNKMLNNNLNDLVLWLRGNDKGEIFHKAINIRKALKDFFIFKNLVTSFTYHQNYDLSGFKNDIENPKDKFVIPTAILDSGIMVGSSFWILQQWIHDFDWLNSVSQSEREECIGISMDDSQQLNNLKDFAHVRRLSKENFLPRILRRSMPWSDSNLNGGLMFSGFSTSFRSFNFQMGNMLGYSDGILDGVFKYSKILETNYLWCPPFIKGKLDLSLMKY